MPKIIFSKKGIPNMRFWIIYILFQISFLGLFLGVLASAFFNFSQLDNHGGRHFYTATLPTPTTTTINSFLRSWTYSYLLQIWSDFLQKHTLSICPSDVPDCHRRYYVIIEENRSHLYAYMDLFAYCSC